MFDPDFDEPPWKEPPAAWSPAVPAPASTRRVPRLPWPIRRSAQAVFAEALRQGLVAGLPIDRAIRLAAEVNPSRRLRRALGQMATHVRSGYPLDVALEKTGAVVRPGLLAALRVGEQHNTLADELSAFARPLTDEQFERAIGRSPRAVRFAAALARLLAQGRLGVAVVRAAGQVAADGDGRFLRAVEEIARRVEDGRSLADALADHPSDFDALFCGLLAAADSRASVRACLERLGARD